MVSLLLYRLINFFYVNRKKPKKILGLRSHRRVRIRFQTNKSDKRRELALFFSRVLFPYHFNINEKPHRESVKGTHAASSYRTKVENPLDRVHRYIVYIHIYECIKYTTSSGVPYRKRWSFFSLVCRRFSYIINGVNRHGKCTVEFLHAIPLFLSALNVRIRITHRTRDRTDDQ